MKISSFSSVFPTQLDADKSNSKAMHEVIKRMKNRYKLLLFKEISLNQSIESSSFIFLLIKFYYWISWWSTWSDWINNLKNVYLKTECFWSLDHHWSINMLNEPKSHSQWQWTIVKRRKNNRNHNHLIIAFDHHHHHHFQSDIRDR